MLDLFKKKPQGRVVTFKIDGMHCTSCSMNIDGELEDTEGVISANTSYKSGTTKVVFDEGVISKDEIQGIIEALQYTVKELR
ncbi:MAG: heavy-metal-associated domain-containing protein [bacterium]|nr:heavy-metal-associated domain-containing protein [bacterium]